MEQGARTVVTLRQTGFTSTESRDGHHEGWTSTLDRLEEFLGGRSPR
ncbi:MAG: SRPBCC domain-containing protein [Gemmatimonadota bacterium]